MTEAAKSVKDLRPSIDAYFKKETLEMEGADFWKVAAICGIVTVVHC
jgi:hypothetical protein